MKLELFRHRCFKIPKSKLDLFLVALYVNFSAEYISHKMEYVFEVGDKYDVIVAQYGSYPYIERQLEEFISNLVD